MMTYIMIFGDSLLKYSDFGQKYISYYYNLCDFLEGEIPLSLRINTAIALINFNPSIDMLLDSDTYGNTIFMDSALKNEIITLLNSYRVLSSDSIYVYIIDDIIDDVNNNIYNKTVNQFHNWLD